MVPIRCPGSSPSSMHFLSVFISGSLPFSKYRVRNWVAFMSFTTTPPSALADLMAALAVDAQPDTDIRCIGHRTSQLVHTGDSVKLPSFPPDACTALDKSGCN